MIAATVVGSVGMDKGSRAGFEQAFFEGEGLTAMDLNRRLRWLSQNPTLKLEAISSSSSSSLQIKWGTSRPTLASRSLLEDKGNEDDKTDDEDGEVGGRVLTF